MRVAEFDFHLPEELIALRPASPRDAARLLVVDPSSASPVTDRTMLDLPELLEPGDALVLNDTKVIPAELRGVRARDGTEAHVSVTLIERIDDHRWQALARPAKRLRRGDRIVFGEGSNVCLLGGLAATVEGRGEDGEVSIAFDFGGPALDEAIRALGAMPLPPYIASRRAADERDRSDYQTVFAREEGAVAAPTAGLHFTPALMQALDARGVSRHFVTLHVGPGTFLPVRAADTKDHVMHEEHGSITAETADGAQRGEGARRDDRRRRHHLAPAAGERDRPQRQARALHRRDEFCSLRPGYRFRFVDRLLDQFPSAALDSVHAGGVVRRARPHAARLCARDSLSATASIPMAMPACSARKLAPAPPLRGSTRASRRAEGGLDGCRREEGSFFLQPPSLSLPHKGGGESKRLVPVPKTIGFLVCNGT